MNPILEAIHTRRSIRAYEPRPVPRDLLTTIIDAANQAPSGTNAQPWRFVVIEDKGLKKKLVETAVPNSKKYLEPLKEVNPARYQLIMKRYEELEDPVYYSAPAIIFVIGSGSYASDSCPLACANLMLAAHALGLGSCWVRLGSLITDNPEIVKALELKEGEAIFGPILIGYPGDHPKAPPKKRSRYQVDLEWAMLADIRTAKCKLRIANCRTAIGFLNLQFAICYRPAIRGETGQLPPLATRRLT